MPEIKTSNPGTLGALESFTPSPPRLSVLPAADRWGDSKIPRSPLAKSPAASSTNGFGANAGSAKGNSPSKLPSPGAIPPSPKRVMTPGASSLNRSASPLGESRIPKPRAGAQASGTAAPETRKQRYVPRATPERSSQSGSSSGGRSGGRPRSAKPKPKLTDLEKGWVGNDVPIEDNAEDGTFAGDEALKVAEELSAPSETKAGVMGVAESGLTKPNQEGNTTNLEANASSSKVDACTQVTPKLGDMTNGPAEQNSPAQKAQACACCDIM
ncbi:hypothetical protein COCSUDRAFT_61236 [Coccomyxa subellipsoidea C-169]|uniref:Uncharacterized protein n=1 Tax=Coccomyxa subellipsoidea (strain C-169) TaxID=574566 RepID=I0Z2W1_COCSC|nr:hypothetical protein COCSUDRAFT_61236 [Coccomyxa subellipsoidea C-169]EIE24980.1 hypothetical protein COCSUDRAFT_61236 [Coccomyxa subellipsoidea C-169]|eukprot:XP_005649524.1 hypothetical protein COCSUDRAFT_61236 [Coccomyxa subellipsoidea C-169]